MKLEVNKVWLGYDGLLCIESVDILHFRMQSQEMFQMILKFHPGYTETMKSLITQQTTRWLGEIKYIYILNALNDLPTANSNQP